MAQQAPRVVRQLRFEGNASIPNTTLAAAIGTTNSSWFATGWPVRWMGLGAKRYFDETEFRRDVLRLAVLYKRSGFPDVVVDTAVRRTDRDVYVMFRIKEGRPIIVTELAINGLDSLPERARNRLLLDMPMRQGDVFTPTSCRRRPIRSLRGSRTAASPRPPCTPVSSATASSTRRP